MVHLVNDSDKTTWYNKFIHRNIYFFLFLLYPMKSDKCVHIYKVVHSYSQLFTVIHRFIHLLNSPGMKGCTNGNF